MGLDVIPLTQIDSTTSNSSSSPEFIGFGYLQKRRKRGLGYNRRWFVLSTRHLFEYHDAKDKVPKAVIDLTDSFVLDGDAGARSFELSGPFLTRTYVLRANSTDEKLSWMKRIVAVQRRLATSSSSAPPNANTGSSSNTIPEHLSHRSQSPQPSLALTSSTRSADGSSNNSTNNIALLNSSLTKQSRTAATNLGNSLSTQPIAAASAASTHNAVLFTIKNTAVATGNGRGLPALSSSLRLPASHPPPIQPLPPPFSMSVRGYRPASATSAATSKASKPLSSPPLPPTKSSTPPPPTQSTTIASNNQRLGLSLAGATPALTSEASVEHKRLTHIRSVVNSCMAKQNCQTSTMSAATKTLLELLQVPPELPQPPTTDMPSFLSPNRVNTSLTASEGGESSSSSGFLTVPSETPPPMSTRHHYSFARAVTTSDVETLRKIVRAQEHDANCRCPQWTHGRTALHVVCEAEDILTLRMLLALGANVNARDDFSATPLHVAIQNARVHAVEVLLSQKDAVDVNARDARLATPLHVACDLPSGPEYPYQRIEYIVKYLLEEGADMSLLDEKRRTPLHLAALRGHDHLLRKMLPRIIETQASLPVSKQLIHSLDDDGMMPLHLACAEGRVTCALVLIDHGADPKLVTSNGLSTTDLLLAAKEDQKGEILTDPNADELLNRLPFSRVNHGEMTFLASEEEVIEINDEVWKTGKYVGKGAFGEVRVCLDPLSGVMFAAKRFIRPMDNESGQISVGDERELQHLQTLKHPNIVRYLGHSLLHPYVYLCLEYVDGGSLLDIINQHGALKPQLVRKYTRQILCGLAFLHEHNVLHRDLKPANILVSQNAEIKLADFGGAKKIASCDEATQSDTAQGTPAYASPEQYIYRQYWKASDVYSVGCTILHAASGETPWSRQVEKGPEGFLQILFQLRLRRRPAIPDSVDPAIAQFIELCIALDHKARPSCAELLAILGECESNPPTPCSSFGPHGSFPTRPNSARSNNTASPVPTPRSNSSLAIPMAKEKITIVVNERPGSGRSVGGGGGGSGGTEHEVVFVVDNTGMGVVSNGGSSFGKEAAGKSGEEPLPPFRISEDDIEEELGGEWVETVDDGVNQTGETEEAENEEKPAVHQFLIKPKATRLSYQSLVDLNKAEANDHPHITTTKASSTRYFGGGGGSSSSSSSISGKDLETTLAAALTTLTQTLFEDGSVYGDDEDCQELAELDELDDDEDSEEENDGMNTVPGKGGM